MLLCDRLPNLLNGLLRFLTPVTPQFLNNGQAFLSFDLDREGRARACAQIWSTALHGRFDIVRIIVLPSDDNQFFETAGDEERAVSDKAEVARAQEWPLISVG